jgi:hypothetical protein
MWCYFVSNTTRDKSKPQTSLWLLRHGRVILISFTFQTAYRGLGVSICFFLYDRFPIEDIQNNVIGQIENKGLVVIFKIIFLCNSHIVLLHSFYSQFLNNIFVLDSIAARLNSMTSKNFYAVGILVDCQSI